MARESEASGKLTLKADMGQVPKAAEASAASMTKLEGAAKKTSGALSETSKAGEVSAATMSKLEQGAKRIAPALGNAAASLATSTGSMKSLASAVLGTAASFGPWGIAIAAAGTALYNIVGAQLEAADAADKHTKKLLEQKRVLAERARDEKRKEIETGAAKGELTRERQAELAAVSRLERERKTAIADARDEVESLEKQIAINKQMKIDSQLLFREKSKQLEIIALREGDIEAARKIRHDAELDRINKVGAVEKKKHAEKKEQLSELEQLLGKGADKRFAQLVANHKGADESFLEFQKSQLGFDQKTIDPFSGEDVERRRALSKQNAESRLRGNLGGLDVAVASGQMTPAQRIEEEEALLLEHNSFLQTQAETDLERLQLVDDAQAIRHQAQMARLEQEKKAETERGELVGKYATEAAKHGAAMIMSSLSIAKAKREATKAALLEGKTSAEAAKAGKIAELEARAERMEGIRSYMIQKSLEHAAEAVGAAARYDFVGMGLHLAAAAAFGAGAVISHGRVGQLQNKADNMKSGGFGAGFAGTSSSAGGGGSLGAAANGPSGIDSQIPGSPMPKPQGMWQQQSAPQIVINVENVYGTPKRDFIRQITEGQRDLGYSEPNRGAA